MNLRETLMNRNLPVHEQLMFCLLLTAVGGFFDAYTFVNCGGIFANAQTGNLIFVGIDLIEGNFSEVLHYSIPILSFVIGVLVSKFIETKYKELSIFKHIYMLLLIQIVALIIISIKHEYFGVDVRPIVISFICAIQFDGFRKVNNLVFASVFCTGNLRSMSEHLYKYFILKKKESKMPFLIYSSVITVFLLGVILGAAMSKYFLHKAIIVPIFIICINLIFVTVINNKFGKKRI
ncbi:MAG: YoaK family protein [Gemella haemolysans]|uniref:YoaK family protein n=1 Tax=Gemella haemolysans TaxID=1379 RepID=UPI00290A6F34|nr:YoaK family protein [Gemella haemolysans]MDU6572786.1 YoaK family protein [Gemella haemolysans]